MFLLLFFRKSVKCTSLYLKKNEKWKSKTNRATVRSCWIGCLIPSPFCLFWRPCLVCSRPDCAWKKLSLDNQWIDQSFYSLFYVWLSTGYLVIKRDDWELSNKFDPATSFVPTTNQHMHFHHTLSLSFSFLLVVLYYCYDQWRVTDLDKERPYASPNFPPSRMKEDGSVFNRFE